MSDDYRNKGMGWKPDLPDHRDLMYVPDARRLKKLPKAKSLRAKMPPVYDQGQLGSCTANAIGAAVEFQQMRQGDPAVTPSRLFIYYEERAMEGTIAYDAGAYIRDGMKVVAKAGAPEETYWPYTISKFTKKPPQAAYDNGLLNQTLEYARVIRTAYYFKSFLAAGRPFVFGFTVYSSFYETGSDGLVPMPGPDEDVEGGHAVLCIGYDDETGLFEVRNSWGADWGNNGYCYFPYEYLLDRGLSSDFWTIKTVE